MTSLNKKIYTSIAVSIIFSALFFLAVIYPLTKKIVANAEEFAAGKNKFVELQERQENFRKLDRQYNHYEAELNRINSLLINSEKPIEFIKFLENNAQELSLVMDISSIVPQKQDQNLCSFNVYSIVLEGSSNNFCRFLEKMENAPYLIEILNLDIKKDRASLGLKVYSQ